MPVKPIPPRADWWHCRNCLAAIEAVPHFCPFSPAATWGRALELQANPQAGPPLEGGVCIARQRLGALPPLARSFCGVPIPAYSWILVEPAANACPVCLELYQATRS